MKKVNLQTQILQVLQDDAKNGGSGLTVSDMAKAVFGLAYTRKTASMLEKMIRERMGFVAELAAANSITVFPKRKPTSSNPDIKSRILCWKIYDPQVIGMNEELIDELRFKKRNGESRTESFKRLLDTAKEQNAIPTEKLKELELHIQ